MDYKKEAKSDSLQVEEISARLLRVMGA
ncbi:hypothetical protein PSEEN3571 [Pseudomonas entomophila L48]|uniref:Uncharacterized protein n=1 Tax=Pseudomonas entomophila (strain L48) TaxID=384676 RepID=Q1I7S4_PSEE4|nr:hypothetical protein PSEEN3571 [Pseudomonas entomophila L48]